MPRDTHTCYAPPPYSATHLLAVFSHSPIFRSSVGHWPAAAAAAGTGKPGTQDGAAKAATFHFPSAVAVHESVSGGEWGERGKERERRGEGGGGGGKGGGEGRERKREREREREKEVTILDTTDRFKQP
jgi:hypothetical protein